MNQIYKEFLDLKIDQQQLLDAWTYGGTELAVFKDNGVEVLDYIQYEDYAKARKNDNYDSVEADLIVMYKDMLFRSGRTDIETSYSYEYEEETSYSYGTETQWEQWQHIELKQTVAYEYAKVTD